MGKLVDTLSNLSFGAKAAVIVTAIAAGGTVTGFSLAAASNSNGNGNGNGNGGSSNGAPAQPVIGSSGLPSSPTNATTATFTYTDSANSVNFFCSLDAAAFTSCPSSGITYNNLGNATHTFRVEAQHGNGNAPISSAASFAWTVANQSFTISGSLKNALAPGSPAQALDLQISNPYSFAIKVSGIVVTLVKTSNSGCTSGTNFQVTQYSGPSFTMAAGLNENLSQVVTGTQQLPHVQMLNLDTNQDVCKSATLTFSYTGSATTP